MNKYVNICGIPHKVIECDDNFNVDLHFGQIDYAKCEIKINKCLGEKSREETLAHEMLHGIFVHLGFEEYAHDEHLVQALANAIAQGFSVRLQTEGNECIYRYPDPEELNSLKNLCRHHFNSINDIEQPVEEGTSKINTIGSRCEDDLK